MSNSTHDEQDDEDELKELLAHERGEPPAGTSSPALEQYRRLGAMITDLPAMPAGSASTSDWHQRTLAGMQTAMQSSASPAKETAAAPAALRARTGSRRSIAFGGVGLVATAIIVIVAIRPPGDPSPATPRLEIAIQRSSETRLATDTAVGDTLIARGELATAGELRVYDELGVEIARCSSASPGCAVTSGSDRSTLTLTLQLRFPAELRVVMFSAPLAGPSQGLALDVAAADRANITVTTKEPIRVR